MPVCDPYLLATRQKLRTPEGQRHYRQRKTIVEPVFGGLKEQRGMRRFRKRGMEKVAIEWTLIGLPIGGAMIVYLLAKQSAFS